MTELSGYDLDVAVAERVMGWRRIGRTDPYRNHVASGGCITADGPQTFRPGSGTIPFDWSPSRSISDAMDVLRKARGREGRRAAIHCRRGGEVYDVVIHRPHPAPAAVGTGATPGEAICRAALKAAGGVSG